MAVYHTRLAYFHSGRNFRLMNVTGNVVQGIFA
jgi:hypothetical protein